MQKEYARNGDADLGDLLVDLLVERSKQLQRDMLQIVLNESLKIAPKLTMDQLAVLAITFLFKYTRDDSIADHDKLGQYFDHYVRPFSEKISENLTWYQHLEFFGCGSITMGSNIFIESNTLQNILRTNYQGLFLKGFDPEEVEKKEISLGKDPRIFITCLNDADKLQVGARSLEDLEKLMNEQAVSQEDKDKIIQLFNLNKMNDVEIKSKCIEIRPYMESVFDVWSKSVMKNFTLTSVGIAIGHANIKRFVGEFENLSIWIN